MSLILSFCLDSALQKWSSLYLLARLPLSRSFSSMLKATSPDPGSGTLVQLPSSTQCRPRTSSSTPIVLRDLKVICRMLPWNFIDHYEENPNTSSSHRLERYVSSQLSFSSTRMESQRVCPQCGHLEDVKRCVFLLPYKACASYSTTGREPAQSSQYSPAPLFSHPSRRPQKSGNRVSRPSTQNPTQPRCLSTVA